MKSYITHSVTVMGGIFEDAATRWPDLRRSLDKDLSYLRRAVESRGLPFLTVTLPSAGKILDKGLDDGYLDVGMFPQGYPLIKGRPKFLQGLFQQVFDKRNLLRDNASVDAVAFLRQFLYCCKKLRLQCDWSIVEETLNEFFKIDRSLPSIIPGTWGADDPHFGDLEGHPLWGGPSYSHDLLGFSARYSIAPHHWSSLRRVCRYVTSTLGEPDWWNISPQHGPGAVADGPRGESKFDFPSWPKRLEKQFPFDWFGAGLLQPGYSPSPRELPAKLHAVPKDQSGPRLICAEPISHQWIQQGISRWLDSRLRATFLGRSITLDNQENSRNRALRSSVDGKLATIDLSQASDRLSARLVHYVFQGSSLLDGMNACRTQYVHQDLSKDLDSHLVLRKFSTMGSALTMPIQSIVYTVLATWAVMLSRGWEDDLGKVKEAAETVTVYGDDIICPTQAVETVKLVLSECGLVVNNLKSYGGSNFRESCGIQAFRGYNVTYVRILQPHDDSPSMTGTTVEVANNLFRAGYWHASKAVSDQISPADVKKLRVCGPHDGAFGLMSFCGSSDAHLKKVYNRDLQRHESISLFSTSKVVKVRGRGMADLSQYFFENPRPDVNWTAGTVSRVKLRKGLTRVPV